MSVWSSESHLLVFARFLWYSHPKLFWFSGTLRKMARKLKVECRLMWENEPACFMPPVPFRRYGLVWMGSCVCTCSALSHWILMLTFLREGITCIREAKRCTRNYEAQSYFCLKSHAFFGIFMDYLLLHTGFLIPNPWPWPYSRSWSHLLLAPENMSRKHALLGKHPLGMKQLLFSHSISNQLWEMRLLCLYLWEDLI